MSDSLRPSGQPPLSMGFFRQEYWSGLPFPPPEDLPDPGIKPASPALQADSLPSVIWETHKGKDAGDYLRAPGKLGHPPHRLLLLLSRFSRV